MAGLYSCTHHFEVAGSHTQALELLVLVHHIVEALHVEADDTEDRYEEALVLVHHTAEAQQRLVLVHHTEAAPPVEADDERQAVVRSQDEQAAVEASCVAVDHAVDQAIVHLGAAGLDALASVQLAHAVQEDNYDWEASIHKMWKLERVAVRVLQVSVDQQEMLRNYCPARC